MSRLNTWITRHRRWLIGAGCLFTLYAVFGFLIAPGILKSKLEQALSDALHRQVRIAKIRVNPLVPSVTVDGLDIQGKQGGSWVSCERIYVNVRIWPLLRHRIALKELALIRPSVAIALDEKGRPDFADLYEGPPTPAATTKPSSPWAFDVDQFSLTEGRLPFIDRSTQPDFHTVMGPWSLNLDGFHTDPGKSGQYTFDARTDVGERLAWSGSISVAPLASTGHLIFEHIDLARYQPYVAQALSMIMQGRVDLDAPYTFEWSPARHVVTVDGARLALSGINLARAGAAAPDMSFPHLEASGIRADLLANRVEVGLITAKDATAMLTREKNGGIGIAQLFAPPAGIKPKDPAAKPLDLKINDIALQNTTLQWDDEAAARPVHLVLTQLDLLLKGFTLDPKQPADVDLQTRVGSTGTLHLKGPTRLMGFTADFAAEAQGLDLAPFDPYLSPATDLLINKGSLGLKGRMKLAFEGTKRDGLGYQGDASIDGFEAADGRDHEVLLRWKRLQLAGLDTATAPLAVTLKTLTWSAPEGRLVIATDGTTNVARALKLSEQVPPSPPAAVVTPTPVQANGAPMKLAIGLMALKEGRLTFIDRSLQPNAALLLDKLEGRYEKLSTDPNAVSAVSFKGLAGGLAPLSIEGRAMPFRTDQDTDVTLKIEGADLADFDPYVRKYLGYTVQKGKLDVNSRVTIQHRALDAENKAGLDQFYLGDKVQSPDATHLPVKLALAILRDRHGVIDLDVPVKGSLDDPDIKWGGVVWHALFNVLGKVAASPFTLIGKMFGGGEDLSALAFEPGSAKLAPDAQAKLSALTKALIEKPEIHLEVEGAADPAADGAGLRKAELERQLKVDAWKQLTDRAKAGQDEAAFTLTPDQRQAALKARYAIAFPPEKSTAKAPEPPIAEMEQRLLGAMPMDQTKLDALAQARAKAVLAALQTLQAPQDRVFETKGTRSGAEATQAKVWFAVK